MKKKFLALVMTLSMVLSLVPMTALATGEEPTAEPKQETQADVQVGQKEPTASVAEEEPTQDEQKTEAQKTPASEFTVDGLTYEVQDDAESVKVIEWDKVAESVTIPVTVSNNGVTYKVSSLTTNNVKLFQNQKGLKSINIEAKVTTLANSMFYGCSGLTEVTLPDTLEIVPIGAFQGCTNLTSITLPQNVKEVGASAFEKSGLQTIVIPSGVTKIQNSTFANCSNLQTISGLENVNSIGEKAFYQCKSLSTIEGLHQLKTIDTQAFFQCAIGTGIKKIDIDWSKVESIGNQAFCIAFAKDAEEIVLDGNSFRNLKKIGDYAFAKASNLTGTLVLPEGIASIGMQAFAVTGISSVVLPNSLISIGWWSFNSCENLESVIIGNNNESAISTLDKTSFRNCNKLASVEINASKDQVDIPDGTFKDTVTVRYTLPSIQESSAETERLISAAQTGGTIELNHDVRLMKTVTIPSGKTLTITTSEGASLIMLANKNIDGPMFKVEKDAHLILNGDISYQCQWLNDTMFAEVEGTLTLQKGKISRVETTSTNRGAIKVSGGTFNMDGGIITRCTFGNQYSGSVLLDGDGATMLMSAGEITGNDAEVDNATPGVLVKENSTFTMTGGTISNGNGSRGAGVLVGLPGTSYNEQTPAKFEMKGGMISNNVANPTTSTVNAGGGGVFVQDNAEFTMTDGTITGNRTKGNGMGGGVATANPVQDNGGRFTMSGGTISNNSASCGGGVYSYSGDNAVQLLSGKIINNKAAINGGGVYVSTHPYSITLQNALITGNSASIMGGGIWSCPTGTILLSSESAVYDNTAKDAGDDLALVPKWNGVEATTTFSQQTLGGGYTTWYKDGAVVLAYSADQYGSTNPEAPRFDAANPGSPVAAEMNATRGFALKASLTNEAKAWARSGDRLIIEGNSAQRGGGIGTNGKIEIPGESYGDMTVSVKKVWQGNDGNYPSTVTVNLVRVNRENENDKKTIGSVILSEANNWSYTFTSLDDNYTYTVTEDEVSGYRTSITKDTKPKTDGGEVIPDNDLSFTITNTRKSGGSSGGGPITIPDDVPTGLDLKNHYGYIIGYPVDYYTGKPTTDQTKKPVRPEGKITRAEVATIYFRMLTDENRAANWNQVSGFSDVKRSAWYNNAISTLTKAGILKGYEDGTFQPNGYITRAEFATIAIRFFSGVYEGEDLFPDIKGHWAEDYINNAANKGLVKGYEDGTFGPDRYITRAEAVTLVNRTLNRHPHNDGLHKDMLVWPDNMDTSKWYYADMQEATNSHEPDKDKTTADKEYWGKMLPIRDWEALEKEWSNANSAPGEGEVV